jgi:hypothetical protein
MLISIGIATHLKMKNLQKRGDVFQFALRIPSDLKARYGKSHIRQSLRRLHTQEFRKLRQNDNLAPQAVTVTAKELAHAMGTLENFITLVMEQKFEEKIGRYVNLPILVAG